MKWLAVISIAANLVLAGVLFRPRPATGPALPAVHRQSSPSPPVFQVLTQRVETVRAVTNAAPRFNWALVESDDYQVFMNNLRRLECPARLVRELVLADLMRHYRLRALQLPGGPPARWLTHHQRRELERRDAEAAWALKLEEREAMLKLTGTYRHRDAYHAVEESELTVTFPFGALAEDQAMEILSEFMFLNEHKEHFERLYHQLLSPSEQQQLYAEYNSIKDRMSARFSPALFEEFWLRLQVMLGGLVDDLELPGVQLTGAQFRELMRLRSGFIDPIAWELTGVDKPEEADRMRLEQEVAGAILNNLGKDAGTQYARSQNPIFRKVYELTERHQLPVTAAIAVYDIRQAAIDEVRAFVASEDVDEELKWEMRRLIQRDTEKAVQSSLGPGAWEEYRQNDGRWMDRIGGQPPAGNRGGGR